MSDLNKITEGEFIKAAIRGLRGKKKGLRLRPPVVAAFAEYFALVPDDAQDRIHNMARVGVIDSMQGKRGLVIYLPGESPTRANPLAIILATAGAMQKTA